MVVTGVVSRGESPSLPDDTLPQYTSRTTGVPAVQEGGRQAAPPMPPSQPKPQTPQAPAVQVGAPAQKVVTPLPSSSPFDRYSQTHIPIEVRERIRVIVREVVEEAMAPVTRWQKEVDAKLDRLMRQGPASSPVLPGRGGNDDPWSPLAPAQAAPQTLRTGATPSTEVDLASLVPRDYAPPPGGRIDVPAELDGGRRKSVVGIAVGALILIVLTGLLSAMAVSQLR